MRWLIPVGVVLMLCGALAAVTAYQRSDPAITALMRGTTAAPADDDSGGGGGGVLVLAGLSGLALAVGAGCIGVGLGRWKDPTPSLTRTANPWSEQPGEKGAPPTGLV
ncbi:MAG: hypothetical protein AB7O28_09590 [Vicinamibacterales bacterium]